MPQKRRLTNLEAFESNDHSILVATDVAARGLDIAKVDHVVHYQIPRTAEIYIHRSGRTARAFSKGLSLMICEPKEEANYYKQLCNTMNNGNHLHDFPIEHSVLKSLKERINLAQKCDQLDHQIRKQRSRDDWFRINAEKCEILDEDSGSDSDNSNKNSVENSKTESNEKTIKFSPKETNFSNFFSLQSSPKKNIQ